MDEGNKRRLVEQVVNDNGECHSRPEEASRRRVNAVIEWRSLPEEILLLIMSHLDVATLVQKKQVCRIWRETCTEAIDAKRTRSFSTNQELRQAVLKYCGYDKATHSFSQCCDFQDAEEFAQTYGYPINMWDVSNVQDFSNIFLLSRYFNEDISSWNVSSATTMNGMFEYARTFHQDLSSWNVSNVTTMANMFHDANAFNGNISSWDVSNVRTMEKMFLLADAFNQDLSSWNVSNDRHG